REVVERGYLYIAQPPLYRVKKGKTEMYIDSDEELNRFLLSKATEDKKVETAAGRTVEGAALLGLLEKLIAYNRLVSLLARRGYNQQLLETLLEEDLVKREAFAQREWMEKVAASLRAKGRKVGEIRRDEEHNLYELFVAPGAIGPTRVEVSWDALGSKVEYRRLHQLWRETAEFDKVPLTLIDTAHDGQPEMMGSKADLLDSILRSGKEGVRIQRYKGLGEMNPEQLWETTMDPERRRLLQVKIEDSTEAERIFNVLMGEHVVPRRKFIEENALDVRNLDI
ncbi:MAG: DNA gyrase subunit B, partial [Acidobacteriota bacterium]